MTLSPALVWTPRPPAEDEPACWSWEIPPVLTDDERRQRWDASQALVHPDERVDWETESSLLAAYDPRFLEFHAGRCALCGKAGGTGRWRLVDDHCHSTGQVRGFLHMRCNSSEGRMRVAWPPVDRYRLVHPAVILDTHDMYESVWGDGWQDGWPPTHPECGKTERPATPWPAWDPALLGGSR